jgi:hypothetical protein
MEGNAGAEESAMNARTRFAVLRSIALAFVMVGGTASVVHADEVVVTVTAVTIERNAALCGELAASGCVRLSGTMTCDATGPAEWVQFYVTQRNTSGLDDLDLLDYACSTEPRSFIVTAETFGCDAPFQRNATGCFRPGPAQVRAVAMDRNVVVLEQTVFIRR